jgi:hypothetical protein
MKVFLAALLMLVAAAGRTAATATDSVDEFGLPEHARRNLHEAVVEMHETGHRDLQIINGICNLFASFFIFGELTCQCFLTLGIVFTCGLEEPLCSSEDNSGLCSSPVVSGELNILTLSATLEFCTAGTTNGGVAVPGLCVDFGGSILDGLDFLGDLTGELFGADSEGQQQIVADSAPPVQEGGNLNHCTASVLGESCNSCEICNMGLGYTFDCSNVEPLYVQSKCTPVTIISGFFMNQTVSFLPELDALSSK